MNGVNVTASNFSTQLQFFWLLLIVLYIRKNSVTMKVETSTPYNLKRCFVQYIYVLKTTRGWMKKLIHSAVSYNILETADKLHGKILAALWLMHKVMVTITRVAGP